MYIDYDKYCDIDQLVGKVVMSITGMENGSDKVVFACDDGSEYTMFHAQDCCECVQLDDVEGDVDDLLGQIVVAEVVSSEGAEAPEYADSYTWTFYRLATAKGFVVLRWLGESNGYYSESVDFAKTK